jgi:hypothetical protein
MLEFFKIVWDVFVLRDAARKGQLTGRVWLIAIGFVLVEYGIAMPAVILYNKDPRYEPLLVGAMVLVSVNLVCFLWWAWRRWLRQSAAQKAVVADRLN